MIYNEKMNKDLMEWIQSSEDQNDFCERSILVDAIKLLSKDETEKALGRLFELTPLCGTGLVSPPDFAIEMENEGTCFGSDTEGGKK